MSKWDEHIIRFKELSESENISIKDYCERYKLNYNTARRYLKLDDQKNDQFAAAKKQLEESSRQQKKVTKEKKEKNNKENQSSAKYKENSPKKEREGRSPDNAQNYDHLRDGSDSLVITAGRSPNGRYAKGTSHTYKHGLFAIPKYNDLSKAIELVMEEENIPLLEYDSLKALVAQKMMIERMQSESLAYLAELEQKKSELGVSDSDEEESIPYVMKMLKLTSDTGYSLSQVVNSISSIIDRTHIRNQKYKQIALKEYEASVCSEAFRLKEEEGYTSIQTAEYIESRGVKVPALLMKFVDKELEAIKPELPDSVMTNEELDNAARAYNKKLKEQTLSISERKLAIEEYVKQLGQTDNSELAIKSAPTQDQSKEDNVDIDIVRDMYGDD